MLCIHLDVCNYAIMHNHYHVILHINSNDAETWTTEEVIDRWHRLYKGTVLTQRFSDGVAMSKAELTIIGTIITEWRSRLMDISWFMRILNEGIAREANQEDNCTGRFWEGRFYSQALLDDKALAACMAYIDLNPIRAGIAQTPEASKHTSIRHRIKSACKTKQPNRIDQQSDLLFPFCGNPRHDSPPGIQMKLTDYIELVEWSGRQISNKKKGCIVSSLPPILNRLGIETDNWLFLCEHFEVPFKNVVGSVLSVERVCTQLKQHWAQGQRECERLFSSG